MSSVDNDQVKNFLVNKLGFSEESADEAVTLGEWTAAAITWVGIAYKGYQLLNQWFGSHPDNPLQDALDAINKRLGQLEKDLGETAYQNYTAAAENAKAAIQAISDATNTLYQLPSQQNYDALFNDIVAGIPNLSTVLGELLAPRDVPFLPSVYPYTPIAPDYDPDHPDKPMAWTHGRGADFLTWGAITNYARFRFQAYQQVYMNIGTPVDPVYAPNDMSPPTAWALPGPLVELNSRWDGLLTRPLVICGLQVWLMALTLFEPFFQLSGQWKGSLSTINDGMVDFINRWRGGALLWTRGMPTDHLPTAMDALTGSPNFEGFYRLLDTSSLSGYAFWPCGVVDAVMGVEICNPMWWTCTGMYTPKWAPGYMTDEQRAQFENLRAAQLDRLEHENGLHAFQQFQHGVSSLLKPPIDSPCLAVYPALVEVQGEPGSLMIPQQTKVLDPAKNEWTGIVSKSSVTASAPIAVQPNPHPVTKPGEETVPPRAVSETVFGYEISVTPRGGDTVKIPGCSWPVRLQPGDPSLYHKEAPGDPGTMLVQECPYTITHTITTPATTWRTVTDGTRRAEIEQKEGQEVTFTVTVDVCDRKPRPHHSAGEPLLPLPAPADPAEAEKQAIWMKQHGVIWVTIQADAEANQERSFEVTVHVTETAAVDAEGERPPQAVLERVTPRTAFPFKTYTHRMAIPVDITTISVPSEYFTDWVAAVINAAHAISQGRGAPSQSARGGPDPVELLSWSVILAQDFRLLKPFTTALRRATHRRSLTTQQALAELDTAVVRVAGAAGHTLSPAQLDELKQVAGPESALAAPGAVQRPAVVSFFRRFLNWLLRRE
jgi:hypothetical protein